MSAAVDVVVVSYEQRERLLAACRSATGIEPATRLIVVDNASGDGSLAAVRREFPDASVLAMPRNLGFAAAVNAGVQAGDAPFLLLLNNDARLQPAALATLMTALNESVAAAGPRIEAPDGSVELTLGRTLGPLNDAFFKLLEGLYRGGTGVAAGLVERFYSRPRRTRSLSAACLLLRRDAFEAVGGLDERFFLYAEDVDLCRRLRQQGWQLRYVPDAVVVHERGASAVMRPEAATMAWRRSQLAFYRKHHGYAAAVALRAWLALRFAVARLLGRGERRRLAARMLRWTLSGDR